jgi:hypothetical protein
VGLLVGRAVGASVPRGKVGKGVGEGMGALVQAGKDTLTSSRAISDQKAELYLAVNRIWEKLLDIE